MKEWSSKQILSVWQAQIKCMDTVENSTNALNPFIKLKLVRNWSKAKRQL